MSKRTPPARSGAAAYAGAAVLLALLAGGLALLNGAAQLRLLAGVALAVALLLLFALLRARTRRLRAEARLAEMRDLAAQSSMRDPLTGLLVADPLHEHLVHAAAHARRRVEPLSVIVFDVCRLGELNERHGHDAGDAVLRAFARCLSGALRGEDVYGRLGGDQFLVILAGTIGVQAEMVAERVCGLAARLEVPGLELPDGIELWTGCATAVRGTPDALLAGASEQLRRLKALPRDGLHAHA